DNRPLKDYSSPIARNFPIGATTGKATVPPSLLNMLKQSQFGGLTLEYPNDHLESFLEICRIQNYNKDIFDVMHLRLFSIILKDKAKAWIRHVLTEIVATWVACQQAFSKKNFPLSKTKEPKKKITNFQQYDIESLYEGLNGPSLMSLDSIIGRSFRNNPLMK
ncbi:hypothetical protein CR513_33203, partial [Mucuna pruriens]